MSTSTAIPQLSVGAPSSLASSRRTSSETATSNSTVPPAASATASAATSAAGLAAARRNRAALRDFYGLKDPAIQSRDGRRDDTSGGPTDAEEVKPSILDHPGFDASHYVKTALASNSLADILKTESNLVTEIRSLDGDRKALVYDNYSKLIAATETIRKMRANMDPLAPTTSTLAPAIAHIAGTAERLTKDGREKGGAVAKTDGKNAADGEFLLRRDQQADTVKWVVSAPGRYRGMVERGQLEQAGEDWEQVRALLETWEEKGVAGAEDIRLTCEQIMAV